MGGLIPFTSEISRQLKKEEMLNGTDKKVRLERFYSSDWKD